MVLATAAVGIGVDLSNIALGGILSDGANAPSIIGVSCHSFGIPIDNGNDVTLEIVLVVVGDLRAAVLVDQTVGDARFIVQEDQIIISGALRLQLITQPVILRGGIAYGLAGTQPGGIVAIAVVAVGVFHSCQLPSIAPCEGESIPVGQRIANGIVGNGGAIVGCQQILPVGVFVGV